jgi:hypothetical protein
MQRLGNSARAAEYLAHAIGVLKEGGKADAAAVDMLLRRACGHCWPLPQEPQYTPVDTNLGRMEAPPAPGGAALAYEPPAPHSGLVRAITTPAPFDSLACVCGIT